MSDLLDVISQSIQDAEDVPPATDTDSTPIEDTNSTDSLEAAPTGEEAPSEAVSEETPAEEESITTPSPAERVPAKPQDEFDKTHGIQSQSTSGRENRIPYSRVRKIADNAVADAKKVWETEFNPKFTEMSTKVKTYEDQLGRVKAFEKVMVNDPQGHFQMLSTLPAYKDVFSQIEAAFNAAQNFQGQPIQPVSDDMPQPDVDAPDGTKVYSLDGLKKLMEWNSSQTERRVSQQFQERYAPLENHFQSQQRLAQTLPVVQAQIAEARLWDQFNENEDEITAVLQSDKRISLPQAYIKVVIPKIRAAHVTELDKHKADRAKVREELMKELKLAPKSTSAPAKASHSSVSGVQTGPKSLEDVINESIKGLKG